MKVLADTCVWSLALRRGKKPAALNADEKLQLASLTEAIRDGRVVMIGPIRQELLSGIGDPAQFKRVSAALEAFPDQTLATSDYVAAARFYNVCRSRGVECGPVDMLICAVAALNQWAILTSDRGLERCIAVLRSEGLFASAKP